MPKKNIRKYISCKLIVIIAVTLFLLTCKTQKQHTTVNPDQYFTISFYSPGTGIDRDAKGQVDNIIQNYIKKNYEITYSAVPWGREGEVDYCFTLQKLKPKVYKEFFNEIRILLKDKMVHIKEQSPCRSNY